MAWMKREFQPIKVLTDCTEMLHLLNSKGWKELYNLTQPIFNMLLWMGLRKWPVCQKCVVQYIQLNIHQGSYELYWTCLNQQFAVLLFFKSSKKNKAMHSNVITVQATTVGHTREMMAQCYTSE